MTWQESVPELDIEDSAALLRYLRKRGVIDPQELPLLRSLDGGVSNRVVLVKRDQVNSFVVKQALEKLRVQVDWFCTRTRIDREALALRYLAKLAPLGAVPSLIFQDAQQHLLGMSEVPEPHDNWKRMLLAGHIISLHIEQFAILLGSIHQKSSRQARDLDHQFADRSIFESLRLEPYYRYTATQIPQSAPFFDRLTSDTLACRLCIVHGDYSPKNVLIHNDRLVLLDYEVVHFGDPAFDVGFSLAHFVGKANHLPHHRTAFIQAAVQFWRRYASVVADQHWSADLEPRAVRHTLACCLARVSGRSPLEYLTATERAIQSRAVLGMLDHPPATIKELMTQFEKEIAWQSFDN
jgi:tRNA A-37 threonylcarbamoyl transferase component Bud32